MAAVPTRVARFGHIDNLRAVAALLVIWTHLAADFSPHARTGDPSSGFFRTLPVLLNFGHAGVVIFFAISGFVIYGSLHRRRPENAGRVFALSRFFRLYPAYWLSMLAGLAVIWWPGDVATPWTMLAGNAVMMPTLFGQTRVLGLYWTLETELVFYTVCWLLYRYGMMARSWTLPALIVAGLLAWTHIHEVMVSARGYGWEMPDVWATLPRSLAVMFWGALCREAHDATDGFRVGVMRSGRTFLAVALVALFVRWCGGSSWHTLWHGVWKGRFAALDPAVAYLVAIPFFVLWIAGPRIDLRPLRWLGEISYSLYLFHPVTSMLLLRGVSANARLDHWPLGLYVLGGVAGTVAVSALVYSAVERPAIRLGAWLAERTSGAAAYESAETPFETVAP